MTKRCIASYATRAGITFEIGGSHLFIGVYELTVVYDREMPKLQVTGVGLSTEQ